MNDILARIDALVRDLFKGQIDQTRDHASWEAASAVERATFGRVFNLIEGGIFLVMLFGCVFISNAVQNQTFLLYVCGLLWVIPFVVVGGLLARFRSSLFTRIRGVIGRFMGR